MHLHMRAQKYWHRPSYSYSCRCASTIRRPRTSTRSRTRLPSPLTPHRMCRNYARAGKTAAAAGSVTPSRAALSDLDCFSIALPFPSLVSRHQSANPAMSDGTRPTLALLTHTPQPCGCFGMQRRFMLGRNEYEDDASRSPHRTESSPVWASLGGTMRGRR